MEPYNTCFFVADCFHVDNVFRVNSCCTNQDLTSFVANILLCGYTFYQFNSFNLLAIMNKASLLTFHISFCKHGLSLEYIGWRCLQGYMVMSSSVKWVQNKFRLTPFKERLISSLILDTPVLFNV